MLSLYGSTSTAFFTKQLTGRASAAASASKASAHSHHTGHGDGEWGLHSGLGAAAAVAAGGAAAATGRGGRHGRHGKGDAHSQQPEDQRPRKRRTLPLTLRVWGWAARKLLSTATFGLL